MMVQDVLEYERHGFGADMDFFNLMQLAGRGFIMVIQQKITDCAGIRHRLHQ